MTFSKADAIRRGKLLPPLTKNADMRAGLLGEGSAAVSSLRSSVAAAAHSRHKLRACFMSAPPLNIDLRGVAALERSGRLSRSSPRRHDDRDSPAACEEGNGRGRQ